MQCKLELDMEFQALSPSAGKLTQQNDPEHGSNDQHTTDDL